MSSKSAQSRNVFTDTIVRVAVLAVIIGIVFGLNAVTAKTHTNCVVTSKTATLVPSGDKARVTPVVKTENCGTFHVQANVTAGVWSASSILNQISEGQAYTFTTSGVNFLFVKASIVKVETA